MNFKNVAQLGLAVGMMAFVSCRGEKRQEKLESQIDTVSYALGMDVSSNIKLNFKEANDEAFIQGFKDGADSTKAKIKDTEAILRPFFMKMQQKAMEEQQSGKKSETKANENKSADLLTENDSVSYALGLDMSKRFKPNFPEIKDALFVQGYREAKDSTLVLLDVKNIDGILRDYFTKRQQEKAEKEAAENFGAVKKEGLKFLAANKKRAGVKTTASGLQYEVLTEGTGSKPSAEDNVTVHYNGTTPDGTVFDSSVERGEPATFGLNQVIKGWTEGVQLMKEGAKYKFYIPQELAYGVNAPQGGQGPIKPFMPLVFEVELIKINK